MSNANPLGEAADRLNYQLGRALNMLHGSYRVSARIDLNPEYVLNYGRIEDRWSLYVEGRREAVPVELLRASLELRVRAAVVIPDLFAQLRLQATAYTARVDEAARNLLSFLDDAAANHART